MLLQKYESNDPISNKKAVTFKEVLNFTSKNKISFVYTGLTSL